MDLRREVLQREWIRKFNLLGAFFILSLIVGLMNLAQAQIGPTDYCFDDLLAERHSLSDLYCVNLAATSSMPSGQGYVRMIPAENPYGVSVTPEGHHSYQLEFNISELPDPSSLGDDLVTYIAWVTTPQLFPVIKLGAVGNGTFIYGPVSFNKFRVLISVESSHDVEERQGKLVLRGDSPSNRMKPYDLQQMVPLAFSRKIDQPNHHGHLAKDSKEAWGMPPMHPALSQFPGMHDVEPSVQPFELSVSGNTNLGNAADRHFVRLQNGDHYLLESQVVNRTIAGRSLTMLAFNGQHPGPLLEVPQGKEVTVTFSNKSPVPSAIHWHGLRLNYRYDGVPGLTQDLVAPGSQFDYKLKFPDTGLYWFHPHFREDIQMDLGLYANILVRSPIPDYFNTVHREEVIMLDDILLDNRGVVPYGESSSNYMLMGRFGNTFLINGSENYTLNLKKGEVVRFYVTNTSNTRSYNMTFGGQPFKLIGSDLGKYERETWQDNLVIAPSERYILETQFKEEGEIAIENRIQSINHQTGTFFPEIDTLGLIHIGPDDVDEPLDEQYLSLRMNEDMIADIDQYRHAFDRPVDYELVTRLEVQNLPLIVEQVMRFENIYANPVEWSDTMPMMNWASTGNEVNWVLQDAATGNQNMDIDWRFRVGDVVKIRLVNDRDVFHPMQHPIHIHGQRFLVLSRDGIPNTNLVWKDTTILPAGTTADILLELSNPGKWMVHCHIAEHIDSGMMFVFEVEP